MSKANFSPKKTSLVANGTDGERDLFRQACETAPIPPWLTGQGNYGELADDKGRQPPESRRHETVAVQSDPQHIGAEPAPTGDDIAENGEAHEAALFDQAAPSGVQDDGIPDYDYQCAIFFWIPTPESPPRLIGPNTPEDGAHQTEERGKADDPINHAREGVSGRFIEGSGEEAAQDINQGQKARQKGGRISDRYHHDMGAEPEVGIEHCAHHFHGVAAQ